MQTDLKIRYNCPFWSPVEETKYFWVQMNCIKWWRLKNRLLQLRQLTQTWNIYMILTLHRA